MGWNVTLQAELDVYEAETSRVLDSWRSRVNIGWSSMTELKNPRVPWA